MPFLTQWAMPPNLVQSYKVVGMMRNVVIQGYACNVKSLRAFILTKRQEPCEELEEIVFEDHLYHLFLGQESKRAWKCLMRGNLPHN